jgi:hypothetical protein
MVVDIRLVYKAHRSMYPLDKTRACFLVTYVMGLSLMILTVVLATCALRQH